MPLWQRDGFRQVVVWLAAGSAAVAALLVAVLVAMGGSNDGAGAGASSMPSASPSGVAAATASETPTPTAAVTATATATPTASPATTTAPTATTPPATPVPVAPAGLARGWARVNTGLNLREEPGIGSAAVTRLPNDEVVWVVGGPQSRDGYDWYEVRTLGNDHGWIATGPASDPFATSISEEETLLSCGPVDSDDAIRVDGLRPGPLDAGQRGGLELADAIQGEACVTYTLLADRPIRYLDLLLDACGAPVWDGSHLLLKPTSWGDVIPDYKVKRTVEVASALLTELSAVDADGMTNKLKVLILGGQLAQPFACISVYIQEEGRDSRREIETWLGGECLIMTELTDSHVVVKPATGGTGVLLTRISTREFQTITLGQPTVVNLFAGTSTAERLWMGGFGRC